MKQQILVVDDNKINVKLLENMLSPEGPAIVTAFSGKEALEMAKTELPDVILLDIMMPDIDGYEVLRRLKSKEGTKDIPVIIITALSSKEDRIKGLKLGATDFILKPFSKEEVVLRVKNCLSLLETQKALRRTLDSQTLLLDHIDPMVWYLEDEKTLGKINQSFATFFNRTKEEVENTSLEVLLSKEEYQMVIDSNTRVFQSTCKTRENHEITNGFGDKRMLGVTKTPKISASGGVEYVICSAEDITEQNKKAKKMKHLTFHDALTNLYNRAYYEEELKRLDVKRNLPLSVITLDVNGLKLANDIFGHHTGDQLLLAAATVLWEATREDDIIARWGGDEFVALLPATTKEDAQGIAWRIAELTEKHSVGLIPLSLATGVATKERSIQEAQDIFKRAEDRMYRNKTHVKDDEDNLMLQRFLLKFYGIEYKDMQHSPELLEAGKLLGEALELDQPEQKRLELLIKYHDIGKIALPGEVLNKNKELTEAEWEQYKNHVEIGYRIANSFRAIGAIAEEILHHHEHFDGKGFPGKLQGKEIPYLARVLGVLDFYDGLRCRIYYPLEKDRYFKEGLSSERAAAELQQRSGTHFDPTIVRVFLEQVVPELKGSLKNRGLSERVMQ